MMMVKRLGDLMLILFPLIALTVVLFIMGDVTNGLNDAWMEGTKP